MKVELLTTLKYGTNEYRGKGEIFEDPLPPEIKSELMLNRNTLRIIEDSRPIQESGNSIGNENEETQKSPTLVKRIK